MTSIEKRYWRYALWLALFTILYNVGEGIVSVYFGAEDETLALFGFGIDSFIEVMSGVGILSMVVRIHNNPDSPRSRFERTALRITGTAFYLLAAGLTTTALFNLWTAHKPQTTVAGIIISVVSIVIMWALVWGKRRVGHALHSAPILADANCTMVCIYMSIVLLVSSSIYALIGIGFVDSLGALGLAYLSVGEGREAFEKAAGMADPCGSTCEDVA